MREGEKIPVGTVVESKSYKVKYRGWFVNDETLLSHWKVERRANLPFVMAFETLLRLGGNMVIPGTGKTPCCTAGRLPIWGLSSPTTTPSRWARRCLPKPTPT